MCRAADQGASRHFVTLEEPGVGMPQLRDPQGSKFERVVWMMGKSCLWATLPTY